MSPYCAKGNNKYRDSKQTSHKIKRKRGQKQADSVAK